MNAPVLPFLDGDALARSTRSAAFETMWRSLSGAGTIPTRAEFHPARAARFLSEIVLLEIARIAQPRLTVRLVGTAVDARLQTNILKHDYLDYLAQPYRDGAWRSSRLIVDWPCGLWQVVNLHYERGTSNLIEMTMFPLRGDGPDFILVHLNFLAMGAALPSSRPVAADTALTFEFLDVGAGVPEWTA